MKRAKRRDPSTEPFASSLNDKDLNALVERGMHDDLTESDYRQIQQELPRALKKITESLKDAATGSTKRFVDPHESASSAVGFGTMMFELSRPTLERGAKDKLDRRKAGQARHHTDIDTRDQHKLWRLTSERIKAERLAGGLDALKSRPLALEVCRRVPRSNPHTVR